MARRTKLRSVLAVFVAAVALVFTVSPANAGDKELESVLGEVEWGDSRDEVLQKLKQEMLRELRQREDLEHNRVEMQEARERVMEKFDRIRESYEELDGENSGYRVSVVSDEFTRNNDEALLEVDDKAAQRFYFFSDGALFKLVVVYKESYLQGVGFERFVGQVGDKYGSADETETREINGEPTLARAIWRSPTTLLEAKNQREFFATYSLVFADRQRVEQMRAREGEFGGSGKSSAEVSNRVQKLKEGSENDQNADVVDEMVGEEVDLDMKRNAKLDEQGPEAEEAREGDDDGEGGKQEVADQGGGESTESGSSDSQRTGESSEEERDFDNLEADKEDEEDDELIVY